MTSTDLTPAGQQAAPVERKRSTQGRINPKIVKAVKLLETGECKTQKAIAERLGVSEAYISVQLRKPAVQAFIAQRARENISRALPRASMRFVELMEAQSEHVAAKVTERHLEHAGIIKAQSGGVNVNINNNIAAGYVIDLSRGAVSPSPPSNQQVIENVEVERK